jgi:peptidoglycan/xylan/chitin deacetylase (PgdA/CDA1 family)
MSELEKFSATGPTVPVDPETVTLRNQVKLWGMWSIGQGSALLAKWRGPCVTGKLGILTYHRIAPHTEGLPAPAYNVTPERFRQQLVGLQQRGFEFISLREALAHQDTPERLPAKPVVLTFDDCFETVYTEAWPILEALKIPATLFVSTGYWESDEPFPFDIWSQRYADQLPVHHYRPLQLAQYQEMVQSDLIDIGTHTHTHADFREHPHVLREEMQLAAELVEQHLGIQQPTFSFPFGSAVDGFSGPELMEVARQSGVLCALTTEVALVEPQQDPFGWPRMNVFDYDTSATLCGKLEGWYDWSHQWMYRLRGWRQRAGLS